MKKEYKMVTVQKYLQILECENVVSIKESEISSKIKDYLIKQKRNETNEKILEAMLS